MSRETDLQSVSMFRNEKRWDGWQQFDSAEHQRNTLADDRFEVEDFLPISGAEAAGGVEALKQLMLATGEATDADESLLRKLEEIAEVTPNE